MRNPREVYVQPDTDGHCHRAQHVALGFDQDAAQLLAIAHDVVGPFELHRLRGLKVVDRTRHGNTHRKAKAAQFGGGARKSASPMKRSIPRRTASPTRARAARALHFAICCQRNAGWRAQAKRAAMAEVVESMTGTASRSTRRAALPIAVWICFQVEQFQGCGRPVAFSWQANTSTPTSCASCAAVMTARRETPSVCASVSPEVKRSAVSFESKANVSGRNTGASAQAFPLFACGHFFGIRDACDDRIEQQRHALHELGRSAVVRGDEVHSAGVEQSRARHRLLGVSGL